MGHVPVLFDNLQSTQGVIFHPSRNYELVEGDICDEEKLSLQMARVDAVIHLAAAGSVVDSVVDPVDNFQNNVVGTFSVLNAARKSRVKKLVFASTGGAIIGDAIPPVNENSYPAPISPYGASKLCCESYCRAFSRSYGLNIISLRFANVIGPYSLHKKGVLSNFIKSSIDGSPVTIFGDGSATRDYLFVEDLCEGIALGLEYEKEGFDYFHVASGKETSISELLSLVNEASSEAPLIVDYSPVRVGEVERNCADYSKISEAMGFAPKNTIELAVEKTYQWYKENYQSSSYQKAA